MGIISNMYLKVTEGLDCVDLYLMYKFMRSIFVAAAHRKKEEKVQFQKLKIFHVLIKNVK